jgi:RHS repeat-associated protein
MKRIDKKYTVLLLSAAIVFAMVALSPPSIAEEKDDKNGVSANTVVLPDGPGSIEGLGESFKPMLNTGMAQYSVKIASPPGVGGRNLELALKYDSGLGDGPAGIGWTFGPGSITRQTDKGLPLYVDGPNDVDNDKDGQIDEPSEIDTFIGPDKEELIQLSDRSFRPETESAFARYVRSGDSWIVHLKDGTRLDYGLTASARVTDQMGAKIYKWLLEKSTDTNGNVVEYSYNDADFAGSDSQKYLLAISYGPSSRPWSVYYFILFSYEDRPDWRKDFRSTFLLKTGKRLKQIDVAIQGQLPSGCVTGDLNGDDVEDALIRRYVLDYDDSNPIFSYLARITQYGSDGVSTLPQISFSYAEFDPNSIVSASDAVIGSANSPAVVMDSKHSDLIDLNYDGLPDILKTNPAGGGHMGYLNLGTQGPGSTRQILWANGISITSTDGSAAQFDLSDDSVHLADMDGDGISEIVRTSLWKEVSYHLNLGRSSWGRRQQMSIQDAAPPAPFGNDDVRLSDLDHDKRIDVVRSTSSGYSIWFNLGEGQYSRQVLTDGALHQGDVIEFSHPAVHLADINGDGLNDVVRVRPTEVIYCASMGHGVFDESVQIPILDKILSSGHNGQVEKAVLKDINGDGLADLVIERAEINTLWYWLNLGTDEFSSVHMITNMPHINGPDTATRWADMNGNGTVDLIYADSDSEPRLRIVDIGELVGGSGHPNLLTGIDNGLGAVTAIGYSPSTDLYLEDTAEQDSWQTTLPFPVQVVSEVTTEVATIEDTEIYQQSFDYWSGYYDPNEKKFWGFARETTLEQGDAAVQTVQTTSEFHTGQTHKSLKGKLSSLEVADGNGNVFSRDENTWSWRILHTGIDGRKVAYPHNTQILQEISEGPATPAYLQTSFEYDDYGNVISENRYGIIDPNIPAADPNRFSPGGDEILISRQFITDSNSWIINHQKSELTTDLGGNLRAESRFYYDDLPFGKVDKGNLTQQEDWLDTSDSYIPTLKSQFDEYGNITRITNANGHVREIGYDGLMHIYPVSERIQTDDDPKHDLILSVGYQYGYGQISDANDFAGAKSYFDYDVFGRLTVIRKPSGAWEKYEYDLGSPVSHISTRIRENDANDTFDSYTYFDGLARKLGSKIEAENDEWRFVDAVSFNKRGLERRKWLPYITPISDYELPDYDDPNHLSFAYDVRDRIVKTTNPDGTYSSVVYEPLVQHLFDENDNADSNTPKTLRYDGLERLVQVIERNRDTSFIYDVNEYVTTYTWTTLGDLFRIEDAHNNVKTLEYDSLRRKVYMNDPDRGIMKYDYDYVGNLVRTEDAKGQVIEYRYDSAERLKAENYLDQGGGPNDPCDVIYHYDLQADHIEFEDEDFKREQEYTGGRLSWIEDLSGREYFSYDPRGNIVWASKHIHDPKLGILAPYTTSFSYDYMDRVTDIIYPDNDHISYAYNSASFTEKIDGGPNGQQVITNVDYESTGRQRFISYGNGTTTSYAYDNRDRLATLITVGPADANLINYSYVYDPVSNIKKIIDSRTAFSPGSPRHNTQIFQYDDLYRLTRVRYAHKDDHAANHGQIDYAYDAIGNMLYKSSPVGDGHIDDPNYVNLGEMTYTGGRFGRIGREPNNLPGPHALTGADNGGIYEYDKNGNMTNIEGAGCTWDFTDRLIKYEKGDTVAEYTYDYTGRRITKVVTKDGQATQTLYPNRAFEIRPNQAPTKFIFNGNTRIARVKGTLDPTRQRLQRIWLCAGWNLTCLAVEANKTVWEIFGSDVQAFRWASGVFNQLGAMEILHVGEPLWILVPSNRIVVAKGGYETRVVEIPIPPGLSLVGWPRLEPFATSAHLDGQASLFAYDTYSSAWWLHLPTLPAYMSDMPPELPASTAFWCDPVIEAQLKPLTTESLDILYYHGDHLGSSDVITDANASLIQETANYPFGHPRNDYVVDVNNPFRTDYKFTGKEQDTETGLHYFEARYYLGHIGKFLSVDPLYAHTPMPNATESDPFVDLRNPIKSNLYCYVLNNPIRHVDPLGLTDDDVTEGVDESLVQDIKRITKDYEASLISGKRSMRKQIELIIKGQGKTWYSDIISDFKKGAKRKEFVKDYAELEGNPEQLKLLEELVTNVAATGKRLLHLSGRALDINVNALNKKQQDKLALALEKEGFYLKKEYSKGKGRFGTFHVDLRKKPLEKLIPIGEKVPQLSGLKVPSKY